MRTMPPLVVQAVVVHPAQSECMYPTMMHGDVCHLKWLTSLGLQAKSFPILRSPLMFDILGVNI